MKNILTSLYIAFFIIYGILNTYNSSVFSKSLFLATTILNIAFILFSKVKFIPKSFIVFSLMGCFLVINILGANYPTSYLIIFINQLSFTFLLYLKEINYKIIRIVFYGYIVSICLALFYYNVHINYIFNSSSRNMVSFLGIVLVVFYYVLRMKQTKELDLLPSIIVVLFSVIAEGRSSIIASVLLFGTVFFYIFKNKLNYRGILSMLIVMVLITLLLSQFQNFILEKLDYFNRAGLTSQTRSYIIDLYIEKLDFKNIIFGVNPFSYEFSIYNNNMHNSFLKAHSLYGISSVILIFIIAYYFIRKKITFNLICLFILLIRSFTDTVFFMNNFDFVLYYLVFLLIDTKDYNSGYFNNQDLPNSKQV